MSIKTHHGSPINLLTDFTIFFIEDQVDVQVLIILEECDEARKFLKKTAGIIFLIYFCVLTKN